MSIEYLSGIAPGAKINLSQFEKVPKMPAPETYLPALNERLISLSERLNAEHGDFMDSNGQIRMEGPETESHLTLIKAKESAWASEAGKSVEVMKVDREKNPANIAEIATTLLFDKVLQDEFIVVRASTYDDYENSADQLIIDKHSGAVICGLDDAILGGSSKDDGEKKRLKIDAKMKNGGAKIEYGATVRDGKLERKNLKNVPIFYFNLGKAELGNLLESLTSNNQELSAPEKSTYNALIESLSAQAEKYGSDQSLRPELKNNLKNFAPSLQKMRAKIKDKAD